jgi:hypothetical protein
MADTVGMGVDTEATEAVAEDIAATADVADMEVEVMEAVAGVMVMAGINTHHTVAARDMGTETTEAATAVGGSDIQVATYKVYASIIELKSACSTAASFAGGCAFRSPIAFLAHQISRLLCVGDRAAHIECEESSS